MSLPCNRNYPTLPLQLVICISAPLLAVRPLICPSASLLAPHLRYLPLRYLLCVRGKEDSSIRIFQIQWLWRALRSFDQADRAKFLQFVTGTSKVPLQGFAALEGMNGLQKFQIHRDDRSTDRLPAAHTWYVFACFYQGFN